MSLDLGTAVFGVEAQSRGFQKVTSNMRQQQQLADKIGRGQKFGAKEAGKGYEQAAVQVDRLNSAMRKSLQTAVNLRNRLKAAGAPPAMIAQASRSIRALQNDLNKLRPTLDRTTNSWKLQRRHIERVSRATDRFRGRNARLGRSLKSLEVAKAARGFGRMNEVLRDLESASVLAVGPLSGIGARIRALGAITSRSTLKIAGLLAVVAGFVIGISKLAAGAVGAARDMQRMEARFKAATGFASLAKTQFDFLTKTSNELGLSIRKVGPSFAQFAAAARGTVLEGEGVRQTFLGVAQAAAALKLSQESVAGVFKSLEQMLSKGAIQAEELRGQFGERIPGGFKLAAKAMGVTEKTLGKMLKRGEVGVELLPKLAKEMQKAFGPDAAKGAKTLEGAINILDNAVLLFNSNLDKTVGVSAAWQSIIESLSATINFLAKNISGVIASLGAFTTFLLLMTSTRVLGGLIALVKWVRALTVASIALQVASVFATGGASLLAILPRLALGAVGAGAAFFGIQKALDGTSDDTGRLIAEVRSFIDAQEGMERQAGETAREFEATLAPALETARAQLKAFNDESDRRAGMIGGGRLAIGRSQADLEAARQAIRNTREQTDEFKRLAKGVTDLEQDMAALARIQRTLAEEAAALSKEYEKALEKVEGFVDKIALLRKQFLLLDELGASGQGLAKAAGHLVKAQKILKTITNTDEIAKFAEEIKRIGESLGIPFESVEITLASIIGQIEQGEKSVKDLNRAIDRTPKILFDAAMNARDMVLQIIAMGKGAKAVDTLNRALARRDALLKFDEALKKTTLSIEQQKEALKQVGKLLAIYDVAAIKFARANQAMKEFGTVIAQQFEDAIIEGEAFRDVMIALEKDIARIILRLSFTKPLENLFATGDFGAFMNNPITDLLGVTSGPEVETKSVEDLSAEIAGIVKDMGGLGASAAEVEAAIRNVLLGTVLEAGSGTAVLSAAQTKLIAATVALDAAALAAAASLKLLAMQANPSGGGDDGSITGIIATIVESAAGANNGPGGPALHLGGKVGPQNKGFAKAIGAQVLHQGGRVKNFKGLRNDERLVIGRVGERMITESQDRLGDMSRGRGGGSGVSVVNNWNAFPDNMSPDQFRLTAMQATSTSVRQLQTLQRRGG